MSPEQLASEQVVKPAPRPQVGRGKESPRTGSKWVRGALIVAALIAAGCGGALLLASRQKQEGKHEGQKHGDAASEESSAEPTVQVVKPLRGGMEPHDQPAGHGPGIPVRGPVLEGFGVRAGTHRGPRRPGEERPGAGRDL